MTRVRETRSREETSPRSRDTERSRSRDTDNRSTRKGGGSRAVAINLDPTTYETYGLWDNKDVAVIGSYFAPWNYGGNLKKKDGTPFFTLGFFVEYRDLETGEEHTEPVAAGDLNFYAPGLSPNEEDYAGGDAETFRKLASGELTESDVDLEAMRGPYLLPVAQGYDDDGNPIYKRQAASRGTNMDFYLQQLAVCAKDVGIKLEFDPDDPHNIEKYVIGIEGHVDRMSNTLRKGGANDSDFGGAKSKPLVFTEIFEKKTGSKAAGRRSEAKDSRSEAKGSDDNEKPAAASASRSRRRSEPEPDNDSDTDTEPEADRSSRRRGVRKASEPTEGFLADFESKVEAFLSDQPKKSCKRTRMTDLVEEYDQGTDEERWALEVLTEERFVDTFWKTSELFDYDEDTDTAKL